MSSQTDDFDVLIDDLSDDYLLALSLQALEQEFNSEENRTRESIHLSPESDYELALSLSESDAEPKANPKDIVSPQLELSDPNPNIWHLMRTFDRMFFGGVLAKHCIELSWSSRMTRTAGLCAWSPSTNYCSIRLSLPLLQLRSRKDLIETLIHEMIHALLFVTREDDNHESHGRVFHEHMNRINRESGSDITVYHSFHDEVNHFLTHVWRCDGKCRTRPPYFGYVRRAMNRKPGPHDYWFKFHQQSCGGSFVKESEPKNDNKTKSKTKAVLTPKELKNKDIRSYLSPTKSASNTRVSEVIPFSGFGVKLGSNKSNKSSTNSVSNDSERFDFKANTNKTINVWKHENSGNSSANRSIKTLTKESKSVSSVKPLEETLVSKEKDNSCKPLEVFSGKGYVLGTIKKEKHFLPSTSAKGLTHEYQPMCSSAMRSKKKEDIEVIQID